MSKDVFPLFMFCRIVVGFLVCSLKFFKHLFHLPIFKVFMHKLCHGVEVIS